MTSSLLLNSSSLKDLLLGVSDVRKRKAFAAKSEMMVGSIIERETKEEERARKRMRAKAAKKKAQKKRSLVDRVSVGGGLNRARAATLAFNNIYEYSRAVGIDRETVDALERQFAHNEAKVKVCVEKLQLGAVQLSGPEPSEITPFDAELLVTLLGVDMDGQAISVGGRPVLSADGRAANPSEDASEVKNQQEPMDVERAEESTANDTRPYRRAVPAGSSDTQTVPFSDFARAVEGFVRNKVTVLSLAEAKGYAQKNATNRFLSLEPSVGLHRLEGGDSTMALSNTSELGMGGQMDDSLFDTHPNSRAVTFKGDDAALNSTMFVSSAQLARPGSGGDWGHGLTSTGPRIRLENDSEHIYSQSEKHLLPPLRLGHDQRKVRKELGLTGLTLGKRHFTKAGFDASFTRSTPRVLQGTKPLAARDLSEGGGASQAEIEALRWELTVAREGVKQLDRLVDTNIAWVQTNCDMSVLAGNFSNRTKHKCQKMATERITAVFESWLDSTLYWAMRRWQDAARFERLTEVAKQFTKLKAIEKLTVVLWKVITNQMLLRGWQPWLRFVQGKILHTMNKAAVQIQRIARGKLARTRVNNIKLGQVAVTLQNLFRRTKAVAVVKQKRFVREQELNSAAVRVIQKLFAKLTRIRQAKAEAQRRREHRATVRIQKIHRGREGRKRFLEEWMKRNAEATQAPAEDNHGQDLDHLAVAQQRDQDRTRASPKQAAAVTHDSHQRSLFQGIKADSRSHKADPPQHDPRQGPLYDAEQVSTPTKAGPSDQSHRSKRTPPPSGLPQHPTKAGRHRDESPNSMRVSTRRLQQSTDATSSTHKSSRRSENSVHRRMSGQSTPGGSSAHTTPVHSRPPSGRPRSSQRSRSPSPLPRPASRGGLASEDAPAPSPEDLALLLQRQKSATKIQTLVISKTRKGNKHSSLDASSSRSAPRAQPHKRRSYANDGASARSAPSGRQVPSSARSVATNESGRTSPAPTVDPEEAVKNIQKVARGKLARAKSKKLMEDKESNASEKGDSVPTEPHSPKAGTVPSVDEPQDVAEALEAVRTDFSSTLTHEEDVTATIKGTESFRDPDQSISAAPRSSRSGRQDASSAERPHTAESQSLYGFSQVSGSSVSVPVTPKAPSSPMLSQIMHQSSSFLSSFRLPGFSHSRPSSRNHMRSESPVNQQPQSQSQQQHQAPPAQADDRPRSASFFRNPFSGWGSRSNSRESTPVRQRSMEGSSITIHGDYSFQQQYTIPEQPELPEPTAEAENDRASQEEASVRAVQARARGMRDRQRVAEIKAEKRREMMEAIDAAHQLAQELTAAEGFDKPNTAPSPATKPLSAKHGGLTKSGTVGPGVGAAKAPARRTSLAAKADGSKETSTSTGRRSSFDKEGGVKTPTTTTTGRRRSFDKEGDGKTPTSATARRQSFDKEGDAKPRAGVRRASFDKSQEPPSAHRRGSFGEKDKDHGGHERSETSAARRGSFGEKDGSSTHRAASGNREERSATRRASFDKEKPFTGSAEKARETSVNRSVHAVGGASKAAAGRSGTGAVRRGTGQMHAMEAPAASVARAILSETIAEGSGEHSGVHTPPPPSATAATVEEPLGGVDAPVEAAEAEAEAGDVADPMPAEAAANVAVDVDEPGELHDVSATSAIDVSEQADDASVSSRREFTSDVAGGASVKAHSRGEKDAAKDKDTAKEKAAQRKKEAEDKRKADAAKARTAREERDAAKHATKPVGGTPAKDKEVSVRQGAKAGSATKKPADDKVAKPISADKSGTAPKPVAPKQPSKTHVPSIAPEEAAAKIQNRARVALSRKKVDAKKEELMSAQKKLGMLIHWAVVTIQRNFRGRRGRKRYRAQHLAYQVELARRKEECAQKIQARSRGILGRRKAKFVKDLRRKEKQEQEWVESYQKLSRKKIDLHVDNAAEASVTGTAVAEVSSPTPKQQDSQQAPTTTTLTAQEAVETTAASSTTPARNRELAPEPDHVSTPVLDPVVMERLQKLEEMERQLQEKTEKMDEIERAAKAREEAVDRALRLLEEQTKKAEADRLAQQQLLMMAAGPMSHRSDFASPYSTQQRRQMGGGGLQSARRSVPNSARVPDAPPTARSARGGAGIPPDAARMMCDGDEWVQLWDPDETAYYWYCERTQVAQWDAPISTQPQQRSLTSGPASHNATMPLASSRRGVPNSARDAPPTARSARGGAGIPPDAPRMLYNNEEWVQLWDPDESAYYWYCERTQFAQWDAPGAANNASTTTMVQSYLNQISEGEDSGYESAGAMTDYSTDHYDEHSTYTDDSGYEGNEVWHEYWDESAQAKYWYNEATGEASWTRPETAAGGSEESSGAHLAITNGGYGDQATPAANEWVSYIDEDTEQAYWYNVRTGETSWA